jgi:hypothetical protein
MAGCHYGIALTTAIECMLPVLSEAREDLLLVSSVFGAFVGPAECFHLRGEERALPPDGVLVRLAGSWGSKRMLFGCRSSAPNGRMNEADIDLIRRLLSVGRRTGIEVVDLVVVRDHTFRSVGQSTGLLRVPA